MCGSSAPAQPAPERAPEPQSEREAKGAAIQDSQRDAKRRAVSGKRSTMLTGLYGAGDPTVAKTTLGS